MRCAKRETGCLVSWRLERIYLDTGKFPLGVRDRDQSAHTHATHSHAHTYGARAHVCFETINTFPARPSHCVDGPPCVEAENSIRDVCSDFAAYRFFCIVCASRAWCANSDDERERRSIISLWHTCARTPLDTRMVRFATVMSFLCACLQFTHK